MNKAEQAALDAVIDLLKDLPQAEREHVIALADGRIRGERSFAKLLRDLSGAVEDEVREKPLLGVSGFLGARLTDARNTLKDLHDENSH